MVIELYVDAEVILGAAVTYEFHYLPELVITEHRIGLGLGRILAHPLGTHLPLAIESQDTVYLLHGDGETFSGVPIEDVLVRGDCIIGLGNSSDEVLVDIIAYHLVTRENKQPHVLELSLPSAFAVLNKGIFGNIFIQVNGIFPFHPGFPFGSHVCLKYISKRVVHRGEVFLVVINLYHQAIIYTHDGTIREIGTVGEPGTADVVDHVVGHMLIRISLGIFDFNAAKVDIHLGLNVHVSIVFFEIVHRESRLFSMKLHRSAVYMIWGS